MGPAERAETGTGRLFLRGGLQRLYPDVLTPAALDALEALAPFNRERQRLMRERIDRRTLRAREQRPIAFLRPEGLIPRTNLTVAQARAGQFEGSEIPRDLERQWIQGTGPATKPRASVSRPTPPAASDAMATARRCEWAGPPPQGGRAASGMCPPQEGRPSMDVVG